MNTLAGAGALRITRSETFQTHDKIHELVTSASHLAGQEGIQAICIALPEPPTFDDLRLYRELAESRRLSLMVTARALVLRTRADELEWAGEADEWSVSDEQKH